MSEEYRSDLEDVLVILHRSTDKAYQVSDTGDEEDAVWIPKSQCEIEKIKPNLWRLTATERTLVEKGLA